MRWQVQAGGDAPESTHRDLADRLGKLLAQARFGTDASHFGGEDVNGPIHEPVPDSGESSGESSGEK
jgi:hypothetical protein